MYSTCTFYFLFPNVYSGASLSRDPTLPQNTSSVSEASCVFPGRLGLTVHLKSELLSGHLMNRYFRAGRRLATIAHTIRLQLVAVGIVGVLIGGANINICKAAPQAPEIARKLQYSSS